MEFAKPVKSLYGKYLFVYFVGNGEGEERLHFAVSSDGYNFVPLNGNKPVITQTKGKKCVRDPYVFKGQKGEWYIIGTDMKCEEGWESNHALITWKSDNLADWYDETIIDIKDLGENYTDTTRAWAPQAMWDEKVGKYMLYWAHSTKRHNTAGLYYAYSEDMKTIDEPKPLYCREGIQTIDGDIAFNKKDGLYYLYFKHDEDQTIAVVTSAAPMTISLLLYLLRPAELKAVRCTPSTVQIPSFLLWTSTVRADSLCSRPRISEHTFPLTVRIML